MDTSGFSTVGRYGTLSLMKRNEPNTVVTAFGIDSDELTFGRDPSCSVRLYYPDVGLVHCKIVFEERKAFLSVLGPTGLLVDGCHVYPTKTPSGAPAMVPVSNNSEIEIHQKRFRFSYPPKEMRAMLLATPPRPNNRALRLSMIHSAQVFSPRPSNDPRENLRILKSPLKNTFKSPTKSSALSRSPLIPDSDSEEEEEDEEPDAIVLVDGNCPRVVEEERDLVILEDVELSPSPSPSSPQVIHQPRAVHYQEPPQTPRRRSQSRNTLHRAVLIRSAQRAVIRAEREREEAEEEMEVLEQAVALDEGESEEEDEERLKRLERRLEDMSDEDMDVDVDVDEEEEGYSDEEEGRDYEERIKDEEEQQQQQKPMYAQKSLFRKSLENLERLWPFRSLSPGKEEAREAGSPSESETDSEGEGDAQANPESQGSEPAPSDDEEHAHDVDVHSDGEGEGEHTHSEDSHSDHGEENEEPAPLPPRSRVQQATPIRRPLGSFMTPQPAQQRKMFPPLTQGQLRTLAPATSSSAAGAARISLDAQGPQRVRVEEPWKVKDIVVPPPTKEKKGEMLPPPTPVQVGRQASPTRPGISEEEKKAIQERRRSAALQPDTFFAGGVPGMTPSKSKSQSQSNPFFRPSVSPTKATRDSEENPFLSSSPVRGGAESGNGGREQGRVPAMHTPVRRGSDDDDVDTRSLLERMKETVEGMKRRRSVAPSPVKAPVPSTPMTAAPVQATPGREVREGTPVQRVLFTPKPDVDMADVHEEPQQEEGHDEPMDQDEDENKENTGEMEEPFSLLRPGAREEAFVRRESVIVFDKPEVREGREGEGEREGGVVPIPAVVVDSPGRMDEDEDEQHEQHEEEVHHEEEVQKEVQKAGRRLRGKKATLVPAPALEVPLEKEASTSKTTRRLRSKSPKPAPQEAVEHPEETTKLRASTRSTRSRSRTPQVPSEVPAAAVAEQPGEDLEVIEEDVHEEHAHKVPARRTRKATAEPEEAPAPAKGRSHIVPPKRGRKATAEPEHPKEEKAPVRRGRKVKEEPGEEHAEEVAHAPAARRGRKVPAPALATTTQLPVPKETVLKSVPIRKTRGVKAPPPAAAAEVVDHGDEEDDPLDSIGATEEEQAAPAPTAKARGKKKAAPVKEEVTDEEPHPAAAKVGRSRSTTARAVKTPATAPAAAAKSKLPRKAPATVPATSADVDKENAKAPGAARSKSATGKTSPAEQEVKVRVSRSTRAKPAAQVKEEVEEEAGASGAAARGRGRSTRKVKT